MSDDNPRPRPAPRQIAVMTLVGLRRVCAVHDYQPIDDRRERCVAPGCPAVRDRNSEI